MRDIEIYEVGPRDGLQNSKFVLDTKEKVRMINELYHGGLEDIEIASFVHPKMVPHMADAESVFSETRNLSNFAALVPNKRGYDRAKAVGVSRFNVYFSPSDEFNRINLGRTLDEAFPEIKTMLEEEKRENVRAYVSCAFGCPLTGGISDYKLVESFKMASEIANEIVLCDTIGSAFPTKLLQTLELTRKLDSAVTLHLHEKKNGDTDIFANVEAALNWGITKFDASIAGLGGCPFIPESGRNLSTNQLVNYLHNRNYETGVELDDLWHVTDWMNKLNREISLAV